MSEKFVSIFAGRATHELGEKIANAYGAPLGKSSVVEFSDHEFQPSFDESIRGHHVFIVQSTMPPTDNLMELLLMIDAAKRASAHKVIAVIPYFGWARQDRKDQPRVSIPVWTASSPWTSMPTKSKASSTSPWMPCTLPASSSTTSKR